MGQPPSFTASLIALMGDTPVYIRSLMSQRLDLHSTLRSLMGDEEVYFQAPTGRLKYPCIVYSVEDIPVEHANDKPYSLSVVYSIMHISRDPDDQVTIELAKLPATSFVRSYVADGLYHTIFRTTKKELK